MTGKTAAAKHKEGDRSRFAVPAWTTDKLLVFATNGRFYTIGVDKLPGGRGYGEPLRLLIDLPNDEDMVTLRVHRRHGKTAAVAFLVLGRSDGAIQVLGVALERPDPALGRPRRRLRD